MSMFWRASWSAAAVVLLSMGGAGAVAAQTGATPDKAVAVDTGAQPAPPAAVAPAAADASAVGPDAASVPPARFNRWHAYVHDLIGPWAIIGVGASAGIDQWTKSPAQWGTGASGFGKRVASRAGQLFAMETARHGLAAALGRDPRYHYCGCTDFGGRLNNAIRETFTDVNQSGHRVFSIPRVGGYFAGSYAPMIWRPDLTFGQATRDGVRSLAFSAAGNLVSEYVHFGKKAPPSVVAGQR